MLASKILIPVDGSPASLRALDYAIKMAIQNPGSSFVLLNVQNVSATELSRGAPATPVGLPGTVGGAGVTAFDCCDSAPKPVEFLAATVKVYVVPFVRPVTVKLVAVEPVRIGVCGLPLMYGVTR